MKYLFLFLVLVPSKIFAEENTVITIREPIPFNVETVGEIEQKIEKSKLPVANKKSTLKFKTNVVKANVFNPRMPFKMKAPTLKPSYSQPLIPKVLKD